MKLALCLALFVINAETIKPRSVNLALETVFKFENQDNTADLQLIDNVQTILSRVRNAIDRKKADRRNFNTVNLKLKFIDFIKNLASTLESYDDEDLEDVSAVVNDEIRKHHYENCKFYELLDNEDMRRFVGQKLDQIKYTPAETIRGQLTNALTVLRAGKLDDNIREFIDYIDSLYTTASAAKLTKFIDDLKLYGRKSKRANLDLVKIVRDGIRSIIFDHYTSLNVNARRDFKLRLETFWKNYIHPNNIKHDTLQLKLTKFTKGNRMSSKNKQNNHVIYSNNVVSDSPNSDNKQSLRKRTKGVYVSGVTPIKEYKIYEFAKKIDFDGKRLTFQNLEDLSRSIDDKSKLLTNKNNLGDEKYNKSPKARDNVALDTVTVKKSKLTDGRNDNNDIFGIVNKTFKNKSFTSNKLVKKLKLSATNKRIRTKAKKGSYKINKTKHNKTKQTKHLRENKYIKNEDDNAKTIEANLTKIIEKSDVFDKAKKPIFLTLYPEDFTVQFKRKRLMNQATRKKQKKHTIWEDIEIEMRTTTKDFDLEVNNRENYISHLGHDTDVNITKAPESIETLDDEPKILRMSKRKKHKQYHKHGHIKKQKKTTKCFTSKFRKSKGSSEEGISIESFDDDRRHLTYRKRNDDHPSSNTSNIIPINNTEHQINIKNISIMTPKSNPKLNEINNYGALEFWEGTMKTTKKATTKTTTVTKSTITATKPTITATKPTTSATTQIQNTILVTNSSKSKNITEYISEPIKATKTFEIVLRTNDKNIGNETSKKKIINQIDSIALPFTDVKIFRLNVTTVKNKLTTITKGISNNKQKPVTTMTTAKHNNKISNIKIKTKSITRSLIKETEKLNTATTLSSTAIKTSPKFHLGNFLNQSKIDFEEDKKKLLHEKIMKDMEVIFAPTTRPPVSIPKDATDPFKDIEEALDFV